MVDKIFFDCLIAIQLVHMMKRHTIKIKEPTYQRLNEFIAKTKCNTQGEVIDVLLEMINPEDIRLLNTGDTLRDWLERIEGKVDKITRELK